MAAPFPGNIITTVQKVSPPPWQDVFSPTKPTAPQRVGSNGVSYPWNQWLTQVGNAQISQAAAIQLLEIQQGPLSTLPSPTASEAGLLFFATDYGHVLQWNGSSWAWGPGELGSGFIMPFLSAPTSAGWHLCDGSTVQTMQSDGTTTATVLPNYTTPAFLKMGVTAAVGPNAADGTSAATSAGTPGGTVTAPIFNGANDVTSVESADATVASGSGASVAAANHTHDVTPSGMNTAPAFAGAPLPTHTHGPGTLEPVNSQLMVYYRQ